MTVILHGLPVSRQPVSTNEEQSYLWGLFFASTTACLASSAFCCNSSSVISSATSCSFARPSLTCTSSAFVLLSLLLSLIIFSFLRTFTAIKVWWRKRRFDFSRKGVTGLDATGWREGIAHLKCQARTKADLKNGE